MNLLSAFGRSLVSLVGALCVAGCNCGDSSDACPSGGTGSIALTVVGLPSGATGAEVSLGSTTVPAITATHSVPGALVTITATNAVVPDPIVRSVYVQTDHPNTVCVKSGRTTYAAAIYQRHPASNKLWWVNGTSSAANLVGFASSDVSVSGMPAAAIATKGYFGKDVAFDRHGNLWSFGPTVAEPFLNRFAPASLAASGTAVPDRKINLAGVGCLPAGAGMALASDGSMWVSSPCLQKILHLSTEMLSQSADVTPDVTLSGVESPQGLAFDKNGHLWVGDQGAARLRRYDASHLAANASDADLSIEIAHLTGTLSPSTMAFDADGNLWFVDFGGNIIAKIAAGDLLGAGNKTVSPQVTVTLSVIALLEGIAFDESGGLWVAYSQGKFAKLSPAQLTVSTNAGMPTIPEVIVESASVGYAGNVALYPAPAFSPLYSRLP